MNWNKFTMSTCHVVCRLALKVPIESDRIPPARPPRAESNEWSCGRRGLHGFSRGSVLQCGMRRAVWLQPLSSQPLVVSITRLSLTLTSHERLEVGLMFHVHRA